jgi:hypothetical protein
MFQQDIGFLKLVDYNIRLSHKQRQQETVQQSPQGINTQDYIESKIVHPQCCNIRSGK